MFAEFPEAVSFDFCDLFVIDGEFLGIALPVSVTFDSSEERIRDGFVFREAFCAEKMLPKIIQGFHVRKSGAIPKTLAKFR